MDLLKRSLEKTGGQRKSPTKARAKTRT
jgi:hypothetical protein